MYHINDKDLHQAMKKHLRAGSTPGQFGMEGLRIDELRHKYVYRAKGGSVVTAAGQRVLFWRGLAQLTKAISRLGGALRRQAPASRMGM